MEKIDTSQSPERFEDIDRASVANVVGRVELDDIRMVWARTALLVPVSSVASDWTKRTFMGYDVHASEWSEDRGHFTVEALFLAVHNLDWTEEDAAGPPDASDAEESPDLEIAVMFELTYSLQTSDGITDRDVEHFAAYNARFNAWPYWRELAQTITNRMRIPTLLVPVLRVPGIRAPLDQTQEATAEANTQTEDSDA